MSAEQTGRPVEQEWVGALHHSPLQVQEGWWQCGECAWEDPERRISLTGYHAAARHQMDRIAPLIDREREGARAEGMAAVAGPVLAVADVLTRDAEGPHYSDGDVTRSNAYLSAARDLRAAIPTDATEALARLKAQWQADEQERIAQAIEADTQTPSASTNHRAYAGHFARIARTPEDAS